MRTTWTFYPREQDSISLTILYVPELDTEPFGKDQRLVSAVGQRGRIDDEQHGQLVVSLPLLTNYIN